MRTHYTNVIEEDLKFDIFIDDGYANIKLLDQSNQVVLSLKINKAVELQAKLSQELQAIGE